MKGGDWSSKKLFATVILVLLVGFLLFALAPFFKAFVGAFIIFFLFNPLYKWMVRKKVNKHLSASAILILTLLVIILPLFFASTLMVQEITSLTVNENTVSSVMSEVNNLAQRFSISLDYSSFVDKLPSVGSFVSNFIISAVSNVAKILLSLVIFFFALFFLLVESENFFKRVKPYIPFNKRHTAEFVAKFKDVSHATIISTGLLAVYQGLIITVAFWIFGLKGAVLWGFMTTVVSFLPVVGIPLIYIPAALIRFFVHHDLGSGIGVLIFGVFATVSESLIRPYMQRRVGELHPLVTITGVFFGVPMFGLLGLFIGPLLLSFAMLLIRIYVEEYA